MQTAYFSANIATNERDKQSLLCYFTASEVYIRDLSQKNSFLNSKISKHNTINIPAKKVSLQKITDAREKSTHLQSQKTVYDMIDDG